MDKKILTAVEKMAVKGFQAQAQLIQKVQAEHQQETQAVLREIEKRLGLPAESIGKDFGINLETGEVVPNQNQSPAVEPAAALDPKAPAK